MQPLSPVHSITVHHDGMRPFFEVGDRGVVARLEAIRRSHRDVREWGDIGYHYAVDRNGRVWECRPISHQGAHVSNHNEGNVGVLALGNFDQQPLTPAQLDGLSRHVSWLMRQYGVPIGRVRTHREWDTARTVCPGTALQRYMDDVRRSGRLA
jgi:N-acetyl-anhydromuramyl-L-alanine amidase AmpD